MGRKPDTIVRTFFEFLPKNESKCKVCKRSFTGTYFTNLKRHLLDSHADMYSGELDKEGSQPPEKKKKFTVTLSSNEVSAACVQLVTEEKVPLQLFDSAPFKKLTEQIFNGLEMNPITSRNVMQHVTKKYEIEKAVLQNKLKNKMLSLKIDIASRHSKGILGVNVQYYRNEAIEVNTLGIIELHHKHTGLNLSKEIENILADFSISKQQIYTITSDNGRNILKAIECLNEDPINVQTVDVENEELMNNIKIFSISSIRCAAHSMQLAVKDFLDDEKRGVTVAKARRLAKTLRTPTFRIAISTTSLPLPTIDVPTRWSSTYEMLKSVCKYEEFILQNFPSQLSVGQWEDIKVLLSVLEPIAVASKKLQSKQLYFGDFYKLWLETKLTIKSMKGNAHSEDLANNLENREKLLTTNEVILAAIYLDPRIRRILLKNPLHQAAARKHLVGLMRQILALTQKKERPIKVEKVDLPIEHEPNPQSSSNLLKAYLNSIEVGSDHEESEEEDEPEIKLATTEIYGYSPKSIDPSVDIMTYWEEKKFIYPRLYSLAKILHSVPATQVSVERAFSAVKLVLTDLRCNLSEDSVKKIMFLKLNTDKS